MAMKSHHMRSLVVRGQGRFIEAKQLCESTIREAHELGLDQWLAHPFYVLALLAGDRGNFQEAVHWIRESLVRLTDTREVAMLAQCHHFLGEVAFLQGDLTEARAELESSLWMGQQIGSLRRVATTTRLLGLCWLLPSLRRILLLLLHFLCDVSSSPLPCRGIALGTSVQKIGMLHTIE